MRPTIQIICDVADCKPASPEECKMALIALKGMEHHLARALRELANAVIEKKPSAEFLAHEAIKVMGMMFEARKKDPLVWLGPENTPGTDAYTERQRWAKNLLKKATGLDVDDPRSFDEQRNG